MLLKDFLHKNQDELRSSKTVFEWYFPNRSLGRTTCYQMKMSTNGFISYKARTTEGFWAQWAPSSISNLRKFRILEVSVLRKIVGANSVICIKTDNP